MGAAGAPSPAAQPLLAGTPHEAFLEAWRRFNRSSQRAKARRSCETADQLSLPQALLLSPLLDGRPWTTGTLAEQADVAKPTATRMLDGLEREGYVERHKSVEDRRAVLVSLTPDGAQALNERWAHFRSGLERASASLSDEERAAAIALLLRLADLMDEI